MEIKRWLWPEDFSSAYRDEALLIMQIIAKWNALEFASFSLVMIFFQLRFDAANAVMMSISSNSARLDLIQSAGLLYLAKRKLALENDLKNLRDNLGKCLSARGVYAHGVYASDEKGRLCIRRTKYPWPESQQSLIPLERTKLDNDMKLMSETALMLQDFRDAIWADLREAEQQSLRDI